MKIFIGGDSRQPVAFNVLAHSIYKRASGPVSITKLDIRHMPIKRVGLTEFTYSRYLVPWLCGYQGTALFLDADMLCLSDIYELNLREEQFQGAGVAVVQEIEGFERPSLMLFNNPLCTRLTPEYVEQAKPQALIDWSPKVLGLPQEYNHIVPYSGASSSAKIIHFTQGIPCFKETRDCEYSKEWNDELADMNSTVSWQHIMGGSIHAVRMGLHENSVPSNGRRER